MYRRSRRLLYSYIFRLNSYRVLRNSFILIVFLFLIFQYLWIKLFSENHIASPNATRLYQNLPLIINLRPFSVCHPQELYLENVTLQYHHRYPDKQKQVCFLVEHIDGGPWWSYVTHEFAEILTNLQQIGVKSNIVYRPFLKPVHINRKTNLIKLFLNACDMDENLSIENQMPIIVLLWDLAHPVWHQLREQVKYLLNRTRIRLMAFVDDLHFVNKGMWHSREYLFQSIASEIFSTYPYLFDNYYTNILSTKITWLPHAASTLSYLSINKSAENVLFVSGANLIEWYPCRARAFELCDTREDLVSCLEHPGYGKTMKNDSSFYYGGDRYFSYMRKYVFGLGTCQSVQYAIAKLFEIPANGLALVTTNDLVDILKHLHLYPNEHFLTIDCSSTENLTNELVRIQNMSKERIFQIRRNSQRVIHERHLTKHRAALLHVRLLSQALIASSTSNSERMLWEQWGRNCH
ncbi:unnamed protein product [Rotaria sp. Silwood2]|nr:unnamed protein product [Rotaria sp. Silwood2]CAF2509657.1 unnamed protein product [Rotaria sp. Silwood2]CAF2741938.1 unnamed protein product [Rotaria sp. Silwood2]CAF2866698.1 unnamed protein product [Rotaria sp. Silwood2]CAF3988760.1 unnamed protein product [Rotaria sp. Silwood2]